MTRKEINDMMITYIFIAIAAAIVLALFYGVS